MATIEASIKAYDQANASAQSLTSSLEVMVDTMGSVQPAAQKALSTSVFISARSGINQIIVGWQMVGNTIYAVVAALQSAIRAQQILAMLQMQQSTGSGSGTSSGGGASGQADPFSTMLNATRPTQGSIFTPLNSTQTVAGLFALSSMLSNLPGQFSILGTAISTVSGLLLAFRLAMTFANIVMGISAAMRGADAAATTVQTGAQAGLNAALMTCPITWIVFAILALILIIYAVVDAINKLTGSSISATGVIGGAIMSLVYFIGNIFITVYNLFIDIVVTIANAVIDLANFLANVFTDPIGAICRLFFDMCDWVLSVIETIASALDTLFGTDFVSSVQGWRNSLGSWVDETFGKGVEVKPKINAEDYRLDGLDYGEAWDMGYSFGENLENSFSQGFNQEDLANQLNQGALAGAMNGIGAMGGMTATPSFDMNSMGLGMAADIQTTADNTTSMAESMDASEEDLKYLRDLAEREAVNRFTTARLDLNFQNENHIGSELDLDGVCNYMVDKTYQSMLAMAEGVH